MTTALKALPKNTVEITVELTPDDVVPYLEAAAGRISRTRPVPGFRPGKVPYAVLRKTVGDDILYQEAFEPIVRSTFPGIVAEQKLKTVGAPKIELTKVAAGNPLVYKATVALMPDVTLGDYKTLKIKKKKVGVADEEIEKVLTSLRERRVKEVLVKRPARMEDKAEVDFTGYLDKVPIEGGTSKTHPMVLGSGSFIPGFEEQVVGMEPGQTREFPLRFPANYFRKSLANRDVEFKVTLRSVFERTLPAADDEFAKSFGQYKNLADLKHHLKHNLEEEKRQKEKEAFEVAMLEKILSLSNIGELSDLMVDDEVEKMMDELKNHITEDGMTFEHYLKSLDKSKEDIEKEFRPKAENRIKLALINQTIADVEKIEVSDDEVKKEIEETKKIYAGNSEVEQQLSSPEYFRYLKNMLTNKQVMTLLDGLIGVDAA